MFYPTISNWKTYIFIKLIIISINYKTLEYFNNKPIVWGFGVLGFWGFGDVFLFRDFQILKFLILIQL